MTRATAAALPARLWLYQKERFPVGKTAVLTLAFSSSSVTASAAMAGRPVPGLLAYGAAFVLAFVVMLELRVLDEFKDREIDRKHRPERPVPRGLVTLRELSGVGAVAAVLAVAVAVALSPWLLLPIAGVVLVVAAMTAHFGAPGLMRRSLLLTLLSHMLVMPATDFLVTACEWLPRGAPPPAPLWIFLALSFANGCVLEIGRKTWAPENERPHVESYSGAWGLRRAVAAWFGFLGLALLLVAALALQQGAGPVIAAAAVAAAPVAAVGASFLKNPTPARQGRVDAASGAWILLSYLLAGYGAFLAKGIWP